MPELPEVETVVRSLRPLLAGRIIGAVTTSGLRLRRTVDRARLRRLCRGQSIRGVERRGKYIVVHLDSGAAVLVHLGMTGRLLVSPETCPPPPHTHVVFSLDRGDELRFVDARRFGLVVAYRQGELEQADELAGLGPDPLGSEFTRRGFQAELAKSDRAIKEFLLDQTRVAGLGNIYACEALFRAGISPRRRASSLSRERAVRLHRTIRDVLEEAAAHRGTTFRDFVDADGEPGEQQAHLLVYGREGEPCKACRATIRRAVQGGRSTFYCPVCQR